MSIHQDRSSTKTGCSGPSVAAAAVTVANADGSAERVRTVESVSSAVDVLKGVRNGSRWDVVDLFSGAGGMSLGFHAHPDFRIVGAADGETGKPSTGFGVLDCNATYQANLGVKPVSTDLGEIDPAALHERLGSPKPTVLISCAPCTGFSRARSLNHVVDDPRNGLVGRTVDFAQVLGPDLIVMENARELITGRFSMHYRNLRSRLEELGYTVDGRVHMLSRFGVPQHRERAMVVAVKRHLPLFTLDDLWSGLAVDAEAITVRRAIGDLPIVAAGATCPSDSMHVSTGFRDETTRRRLVATPHDGGSWLDLYRDPAKHDLLTDNMWRLIEKGRLNAYADSYGRLAWDRPAPTIKRECSHVGNGRYAHPEQDRLATVREMAILQGFPRWFTFKGQSRKNWYRQVGDAVPPIVSHQIAHLCAWMLTDRKPDPDEVILPETHLQASDIVEASEPLRLAIA